MECSRVFVVVFTGLILATAGFFLTLAGWFAPPINNSVRGVRLAGPIMLVVGLTILLCACLSRALGHNECCSQCIQFYSAHRKQIKQRHLAKAAATLHVTENMGTQFNPLLLDEPERIIEDCDVIAGCGCGPKYPLPSLPDKHFAQAVNNSGDQEYSVIANHSAGMDITCTTDQSQLSTCQFHNKQSQEYNTSSLDHWSTYEGVGVRVKALKSDVLPLNNSDESVKQHFLSQTDSFSSSFIRSNLDQEPIWTPSAAQCNNYSTSATMDAKSGPV